MSTADLTLSIGEVAAMVGISPDTIRAWERRHNVLTPARTSSRHRRYTIDDVDVLRRVRQNVAVRGMSLKLAVAEARERLPVSADSDLRVAVDEPTTPVTASVRDAGHERDPVESRWRAVADLLPALVCVLDPGGVILDANMAFARTAGMLRMRVRGTRFLNLVEPGDRAKATRLYRPRPQSRRGWELNLRTAMVSGLFSFDSHVVPTADTSFLVLIGRDLSASGMELWPGETLDPPNGPRAS